MEDWDKDKTLHIRARAQVRGREGERFWGNWKGRLLGACQGILAGHVGKTVMEGTSSYHLCTNLALHNAHINEGLLACTHSSVAPKFAHDLPSCYIP